MKVGISAISYDLPKIYLPIKELAAQRNIEPAKLEKGLGLIKMSFPDVAQDAVTFASNALLKLINQEKIDLKDIYRIYVGTESGVDSSKPIASYLISNIESIFGKNTLLHCDAVDFTFACVGAVDAMQTCLDFARVHPEKKAIVIATDTAKYDLGSSGEYTQGAGAVALLIEKNPKIIAFDTQIGISTQGVFDFFKPRRIMQKDTLTNDENWFEVLEDEIEIFKEQPVFDGQYSNQCYIERTEKAYLSLKKQKNISGTMYKHWKAIVMHLPYAYQARRMFSEIFVLDDEKLLHDYQNAEDQLNFKKAISKSDNYLQLVADKITPSEKASSLIGNMYTASIFMGFLSALEYFYENNIEIEGETFGFLAYGSGSKSKVFEGIIQNDWKEKIKSIGLFNTLNNCIEIDIETYEKLHKKQLKTNVITPKNEFILAEIESKKVNLMGARYYKFVP